VFLFQAGLQGDVAALNGQTHRNQSDDAEMSWVQSVLGPKYLDTLTVRYPVTVTLSKQKGLSFPYSH